MKNVKKVDGLDKLSLWEKIYATQIALRVNKINKDEKILKNNKKRTILPEDS